MEGEAPKKSAIADSILAKFQQINKDKEDASKKMENKEPQPSVVNNKRKVGDEILHKGTTEEDVGISKFMSDHEGFKGILKHRFSDFQVHEIGLDGNVVELTNLEPPPISEFLSSLSEDLNKEEILPKEFWDKLETIITNESDEVVEIDISDKDKAQRTVMHKIIKKIYGTKVFSNTKIVDEKPILKVGRATNPELLRWPKDLPQFLHFTTCKKNMDTTHLIYLLSKKARCRINNITYAGTKDRRGVTSQRVSIRRKKAEDLAKCQLWGVKLGNYEYHSKPLRLGDLSGNKFTITIRKIDADDERINKAFENVKEFGFINYYGLQRFGSSAVAPTFEIGKAILKKDWALAVELLLKPRPDEKAADWVKMARKAWWNTKDAKDALRHLSKHQNSIEYRVLQALKTSPTDFYAALMTIPRNTLLLYLHSYQSHVWNRIVSRRIEKFGKSPLIGDLVGDDPLVDPVDTLPVNEDKEEEDEEDGEKEEGTPVIESGAKPVKVLTEEDLESTSIYEVVYPLPGHDIELPRNEIADWYGELLAGDNLSLDDLKSNSKLFSLFGAYRKPFLKVEDLSWKIVKHKNFDDDFVLTDLDKLQNATLPESEGDEYKSVVVDVSLKPSTYATMVLREIMKANTSVSYHALLTRNAYESSEKKAKVEQENPTEEMTNGNKI